MGLDQRIIFPPGLAPPWPAFVDRLKAHGVGCQLRMIDGELSFPDETPPEDWRELRLSTPHGMITLRRELDGLSLVIWGNADAELLAVRDKLGGVLLELTQGKLQS